MRVNPETDEATPEERPILFSGPMVRAILERRKTVTRRVVKMPPDVVRRGVVKALFYNTGSGQYPGGHPGYSGVQPPGLLAQCADDTMQRVPCPHGSQGDRLWVKETFAQDIPGCPRGLTYRADHADPAGDGPANPIRWKPSIFMPRWASRLTLELVSVRVERLEEIDNADALLEGAESRDAFITLWESINGKRLGCSWESNPLVWREKFRVVAQ